MVIEILDEISEEKWGFVQSRRKISYVTSTAIKMKIGQGRGADYIIKARPGTDKWKCSLKFELSIALAEYLKNSNYEHRERTIAKINNVQMGGVYVDECTMQESQLLLCNEYNAYQRTFVYAPTDWIQLELKPDIEQPKIFSREDYM